MAHIDIEVGGIWMDATGEDDIALYLAVGRTAHSLCMTRKEFDALEYHVAKIRKYLDGCGKE